MPAPYATFAVGRAACDPPSWRAAWPGREGCRGPEARRGTTPTSLGRRKSTRRRRAVTRPSASAGAGGNFNVRGGREFGFGAGVRERPGRRDNRCNFYTPRERRRGACKFYTVAGVRLRRKCDRASLSRRSRPPSGRGKRRPAARPASASRRGCRSTAGRRSRRRGDTSGA